MTVRPAAEADYEQLMRLYNGFVDEDRYSRHDNDSFNKVLNSPTNFIFVAEEANKLIGFISLSIRSVVRYKTPIAEVDEIYLAPQTRSKGYGKALMKAVIDKAKELNCHKLYVESAYKWKVAHKFYESIGFTNYGINYYLDL